MSSEPPGLLRDLWRRRAAVLAANVAAAVREHREIAHAATLIGEDYHDRFLVELIQNANDQALLGDAPGSTVVVVRSEHFVAVSNGGQVVTARNLERISSLADSDKTGLLVGNKGVGFKAVYQVTDGPEVYSASEDERETSVLHRLAVGFALERRPFDEPAVRAAVEHDLRLFFEENEGLARLLSEAGHEDPTAAVLPELEEAAGFKFPTHRGGEALSRRLEALRFPAGLRPMARTLVVLPLRDEEASRTTERVVDALVGEGKDGRAQAELAVLFLAGVGRIEIIDHVRERHWSFSCARAAGVEGPEASVVVRRPDGTERVSRYWTASRDVFDCDADEALSRRLVVDRALRHFGLEAWSPDDPLHVTVALPQPNGPKVGPLGPSGRFCLGLPTEQSTGLPAHVDARFFAKINRDGVNFDQGEGYNGLLLDVATEVFGDLLARLRASASLDTRRAATLALHRPYGEPGALAERVYVDGGIADGEVVLGWRGDAYLKRAECVVPFDEERALLPLLDDALSSTPDATGALPERQLVVNALDELVSMGIDLLGDTIPHPWLATKGGDASVVETAARLHRDDGSAWWEPFIDGVLRAFPRAEQVELLRGQRWLPTGAADLSKPESRVFLPAPTDPSADDEEVTDVPPRVAATLRLVDGSKLRLREDGRALTPLAARLADAKLVRRPRKVELLEDALFPALAEAVEAADEALALDLFAQAVAWIASMKDASRKKLETADALVPVRVNGELRWMEPGVAYFGNGWGLDDEHDRLLAAAYPDARVIPLSELTARIGLPPAAGEDAVLQVAEALGLASRPRVLTLRLSNPNPLVGARRELTLPKPPTSDVGEADALLAEYLRHLCGYGTTAQYTVHHGLGSVCWIDGLDREESRLPIFDLLLTHADHYAPRASTYLRRQSGHIEHGVVPQLWAFALSTLGWPLVPVERGVGGEARRVPASEAWLLADGSRRTAFAKLVNVVPQRLASAWPLLHKLGVWTVENAPVSRLVHGLETLAARLDRDHLDVHRDALSLARELYSQIEERGDGAYAFPSSVTLPLLRSGRLCAVASDDEDATVLFDDDPGRTKHVAGAALAYRVPVGRDAKVDRLHGLFAAAWGDARVIRASTAPVDLGFQSSGGAPESLLAWLARLFPHTEVAVDLAVLLTLGGDRALRTERVSRNWRLFRELEIEFGSFASPAIRSFYDRPRGRLLLTSTMKDDPPSVVAATWELAGARSRDLWESYARALRDSTTVAFLREREITPVEIIDVADAAGLHRAHSIEGVECAILAAFVHLDLGDDLSDAAAWWATVERTPQAVAEALGRPEVAPEIERAVRLPQPEGEVHLVRILGLPWASWHAAVERRDGRIFHFEWSVARYRVVIGHLVAVVREIVARSSGTDLAAVGAVLDAARQEPAPRAVAGVPPEDAEADRAALDTMLRWLKSLPELAEWLRRLPPPPWPDELPVPDDTRKVTKRSVLLYRDHPTSSRQGEAKGTVDAVLAVAAELAPVLGEAVDPRVIAQESSVARLVTGAWANVYAALAALRDALLPVAPATVGRLSEVRAFRDPTRIEPLRAKLPELTKDQPKKPPPKVEVLGVELSNEELRGDLAAGSAGSLGSKLALAAARGVPPGLLNAARRPIPAAAGGGGGPSGGGNGGKGGSGKGGGKPTREPEIVGDLGEALVHEWLTRELGEHYGPECWKSRARERYGLPAEGDDGLGYDFEVCDPSGKLFPGSAARVLIEVKSTRTDGGGPFPMSRNEWDTARRCHEAPDGSLYVIVRVFKADTDPLIGDVLRDPFAAHRRGEVQLAERDLWVTVSPPVIGSETEGTHDEGGAA